MFPETAGRTLEEVEAVFETGNVFTAWKSSDRNIGKKTLADVSTDKSSEEYVEKTRTPADV
jgi:hypothetical protein